MGTPRTIPAGPPRLPGLAPAADATLLVGGLHVVSAARVVPPILLALLLVLVCAVALLLILLLILGMRRWLRREVGEPAKRTRATSATHVDPWVEAGRRARPLSRRGNRDAPEG